MYTADVLLNGQPVGGTDYGYVGFEIDISDHLKYGEGNLIEVVADTREPGNSRWYTGGGLYRNVSIITTPKDMYFNRHPLYITTRDNRFVSISAEFTNRTRDKATNISIEILDPDGETVYDQKVALTSTQDDPSRGTAYRHRRGDTRPESMGPRHPILSFR